MNILGEHLRAECRGLLRLNPKQRVHEIQKDDRIWIDYPKAAMVFDIVEQFCRLPPRAQAPCLVVYGEGGTGKSSIIRQLKRDKGISQKSVFVALNVNPYNFKFNELLADALGVPAGPQTHKNYSTLTAQLAEVIKLRQIKCLVIDELHDALLVTRNEQQRFLSLLKGLSNEPYGLSIVGFGTSLASSALSSDKQMSRRFQQVQLEDWKETEAFRSFLVGLEEQLPLSKPSHLDSEDIVMYLISNTYGRMDDVMKLVRAAACHAITTGLECITIDLLDKAQASPWGY